MRLPLPRLSMLVLGVILACGLIAIWRSATGRRSAAAIGQPGCSAPAPAEPDVTITDRGAVRGERAGQMFTFKGIPYAAPPVGALRWQPPTEPSCWEGVRPATAFGPVCPQIDEGEVIGDEDCLTLNLWTPTADLRSPPESTGLPVMVFIHGGGNAQGSSSRPLYDGRRLAEAGVVLVTINYRLGPLGFLSHPTLAAESGTGASGNYGILDQIAALQWVQRNIASFGGDPARVTIFGESAGAVDTCVLIASPLAAGLFHGAIMESGACLGGNLQGAGRTGERLVAASPCAASMDIPACLRGLDPAPLLRILPASAGVISAGENQYGPVMDGHVLPRAPIDQIAAGEHNRVPLIVGVNADETGQAAGRIETEAQYRSAVMAQFGPALGERILARYPVAEYDGPRAALVAVTSDARFVCSARRSARAVAANQQEPVYRYLFTQRLRGQLSALGAFHGLELAFVFGTLGAQGTIATSPAERALIDSIIGYWTRFAATGDPNGAGAPEWPRFDPVTDTHIILGTPVSAGAGIRTAQCDFWEELAGG